MVSVAANEPSTERLSALRDLITLRDTPSNCRLRLGNYPWDGQPVMLTRSDVEAVLRSFLDNRVGADDVEDWADFLEVREDVEYEREHREWLNLVLWSLSDQQLNGPIRAEVVLHFLSLDEASVRPK